MKKYECMFMEYCGVCILIFSLLIERSIQPYLKHAKPTLQKDISACPYISIMRERAEELCHLPGVDLYESIARYHCLQKQSGGYVELCIEPVAVKTGLFPKWSSSYPQKIYFEECPRGFYQSREGWSNEINKCKMKSKCSKAVGQLSSWCPEGGTSNDQQCRCDFQRGYISNLYAFRNPQNKSCFTPSSENSACSMDNTCFGDRELDRAYRCVPKCPKRWHRPPEELECKPIINHTPAPTVSTRSPHKKHSIEETSLTRNSIGTLSTTSSPSLTKPHSGVIIAIFITVILTAAGIMGVIIFLCYQRKDQTVQDDTEVKKILPNECQEGQEPATEIYVEELTVNFTNVENAENVCIGDQNKMIIQSE